MIFAVARTHFDKLKRDRAAFVLAFVVPVVFFSVFASIFRGSSSRAVTRRIPVAVVDEDRTANSSRFIAALKRENGLRVIETQTLAAGEQRPISDAAAAEALVRSGQVPLALVVPKGFGATPLRFGPGSGGPTLHVLADTSDPIAPQVLNGLLQKVAMTSMPDVMAQTGIEQLDRWGGELTPEQKARLQRNVEALRQETRPEVATARPGTREGPRRRRRARDVWVRRRRPDGGDLRGRAGASCSFCSRRPAPAAP